MRLPWCRRTRRSPFAVLLLQRPAVGLILTNTPHPPPPPRSLHLMATRVASVPLAELLDRHTQAGAPELCLPEGDRIRCVACGHRCLIGDGLRGICKVRYNEQGALRVPSGYVAGLQCDPVEKKPFFHAYPGSDALTFGMMGCDLHCRYCQNWLTSQALRDAG